MLQWQATQLQQLLQQMVLRGQHVQCQQMIPGDQQPMEITLLLQLHITQPQQLPQQTVLHGLYALYQQLGAGNQQPTEITLLLF